jgi:hypothetical protein
VTKPVAAPGREAPLGGRTVESCGSYTQPRNGKGLELVAQGQWPSASVVTGLFDQPARCILFGISAVAGHVVPSTGSMIDQAASNWNTSLGAAWFLACALFTLLTGGTWKSRRLPRLRKLEEEVERDADKLLSPG